MIDSTSEHEPLHADVLQARVEALAPAVRKSFLSSVVSVAVFGALLFLQSPVGLLVWVVLRLVVSLVSLAALGRLAAGALAPDRMIRAFAAIMAVSGTVWGSIPLFVRPSEPEWRAVVVLWLFGNQSVVTAVCSPSKTVFRAACGSVTLVGCLGVLLYGDSFGLVLAGLLLLGGVYSVSIFGAMHQSVNAAIEGRLTARDLATSVTAQREQLRTANARLAHLADHDELTDLLNRRSFQARLVGEHGSFVEGGWLAYIDLDRFKSINDQHGHLVGDRVLRVVAERWRRTLPADGLLARMGGDEFLAWFPACAKAEALASAERLIDALAQPVAVPDHLEIEVTCSIGLGSAEAGDAFNAVAALADGALYQVKDRGRDDVEIARGLT